jgi:hypothetical protein
MAFRQSKTAVREAMRWREFVQAERDLFAHSGLPAACRDRRVFDYFLMHAELADWSPLTVDDLDAEQCDALGQLVVRYLAQFDDPGVGPPIPVADIANP